MDILLIIFECLHIGAKHGIDTIQDQYTVYEDSVEKQEKCNHSNCKSAPRTMGSPLVVQCNDCLLAMTVEDEE